MSGKTKLRRNTCCDEYTDVPFHQQSSEKIALDTLAPRPLSATNSTKSVNTSSLNSFNDMGHLSRRVFNDQGENHLTSNDFDNTFGYRVVFDKKLEATAITSTTIATCISKLFHQLVVSGEKLVDEGHMNDAEYDMFCR